MGEFLRNRACQLINEKRTETKVTKVFNVNLVKRRLVVLAVAAALSIGIVPAHAQEVPAPAPVQEQLAEVPTAPRAH